MIKYLPILLCLPTLATADPSQASFAKDLGLAGVPGRVDVVSSVEPQPTNGDMRFWIAMDSVRASQVLVRIERMVFKGGLTCEKAECVTDWLGGKRLNPGERLLVMSGEEITEIEFFVADGPNWERFGTLEGPFSQCKKDRTAREEYADGWWKPPSVARAPFPSVPQDLRVSCVE